MNVEEDYQLVFLYIISEYLFIVFPLYLSIHHSTFVYSTYCIYSSDSSTYLADQHVSRWWIGSSNVLWIFVAR